MMLCRAGKGHLLTVARDNTFIVMRARRDDHPIDRETEFTCGMPCPLTVGCNGA